MRKAIITFGVGYGYDDLKYFIHSCYEQANDADVYIFVGANINELTREFALYQRVHFIRYHEALIPKLFAKLFRLIPAIAEDYATVISKLYMHDIVRASWLHWLALPLVQFMVKRIIIIEQLLRTLPHEQIMLTDVRDVLLMADPFDGLTENMIITGIEPINTGECELNRKWFVKTYSANALAMYKDLPVACAGVVIGSRAAMDQYVKEMITETYENLPKIIGMLGADQAIHIKIFYHDLCGLDKRFASNGAGQIATLHFSKLDEFKIHDGRVENKMKGRLAVLHQYDRHGDLARYLKMFLDESIRRKMSAA